MPIERWQVEHGTPGGERWHYRHGEKPCETCCQARSERRRKVYWAAPTWTSVHAARGDGSPRCGHRTPHAIAEPGQTVTCKRCLMLREMARAS
jgi:hypothetical protein